MSIESPLPSFDAATRARQAAAAYFAAAPATEALVEALEGAIRNALIQHNGEWLASQPIKDMIAAELSHVRIWIGHRLRNEYGCSPGFVPDPKTVEWAAKEAMQTIADAVACVREGNYPSLRNLR